uniref:Uncharacterized protein n=1 Tax=Leersia perrieri TaxID=77586 RepID=A0A0D9XZ67_9ORYZ
MDTVQQPTPKPSIAISDYTRRDLQREIEESLVVTDIRDKPLAVANNRRLRGGLLPGRWERKSGHRRGHLFSRQAVGGLDTGGDQSTLEPPRSTGLRGGRESRSEGSPAGSAARFGWWLGSRYLPLHYNEPLQTFKF